MKNIPSKQQAQNNQGRNLQGNYNRDADSESTGSDSNLVESQPEKYQSSRNQNIPPSYDEDIEEQGEYQEAGRSNKPYFQSTLGNVKSAKYANKSGVSKSARNKKR